MEPIGERLKSETNEVRGKHGTPREFELVGWLDQLAAVKLTRGVGSYALCLARTEAGFENIGSFHCAGGLERFWGADMADFRAG